MTSTKNDYLPVEGETRRQKILWWLAKTAFRNSKDFLDGLYQYRKNRVHFLAYMNSTNLDVDSRHDRHKAAYQLALFHHENSGLPEKYLQQVEELKDLRKKNVTAIDEIYILKMEIRLMGGDDDEEEIDEAENDSEWTSPARDQSPGSIVSPKICYHDFLANDYQAAQAQGRYFGNGEFEQCIVPPLHSSQKRIYLPVSSDDYFIARDCGARKERDYLWVENGSSRMSDCAQFLPLAFQPGGHKRLNIDLIPSSSWGASLAKLLTETSWKAIREKVYQEHGLRCELCGARRASGHAQIVGKKAWVEAHELWQYDEDNEIQTLKGLYCLRPDCHLMFHLGFANVHGIGKHYAMLLSHYNGWAQEEAIANLERMFNDFTRRSKQDWDLDVSLATKYVDRVGLQQKNEGKLPTIYGLEYYIGRNRKTTYFDPPPPITTQAVN